MANEDAGRKSRVSATEDQGPARATGSRKPGVVGRMMDQCRNTVEAIRLPQPDWRTFAWGLLILIGVIFIVRNWAPLRINFFGWYLDAPRAVVFAVFFALGMVTTWLIEVRSKRARSAEDEDEAFDAAIAAEEPEPAPEEFAEEPVRPAEDDEADMNFTPLPDDFADADEAEEGDEVSPEPEAFAPVTEADEAAEEEDESHDAEAMTHLANVDEEADNAAALDEEASAVADETVGDAFSDEYNFAPPSDDAADGSTEMLSDEQLLADDDWEKEPDLMDDDEQESAEGDADEGASEEDNGKPFWRL